MTAAILLKYHNSLTIPAVIRRAVGHTEVIQKWRYGKCCYSVLVVGGK